MDTHNIVRFVLDSVGQIYREEVKTELLDGNFKKALILDEIKNALSLSPVIEKLPLGDLQLIVSGTGSCQYAAVKLSALNFHANWNVFQAEGRPFLRPVLYENHVDTSGALDPLLANKNLLWQIPEEIPTYLVLNHVSSDMYLISFNRTQEYAKVRLPVPNYYGDTRLCYRVSEEVRAQIEGKSLVTKVREIYEAWVHSVWNRDLYNNYFTTVFRWDADGTQQIYPMSTLSNYLVRVEDYPKEMTPVYNLLAETEKKNANN